MNVYLEARYARKFEMRQVRKRLMALGHVVVSRWLDEADDHTYENATDEEMREHSLDDIEDVRIADIILHFSDVGLDFGYTAHGGKHVEFGAGLILGVPIVVIGPPENIYHRLLPEDGVWRVDTEEEAFDLLDPVDEYVAFTRESRTATPRSTSDSRERWPEESSPRSRSRERMRRS